MLFSRLDRDGDGKVVKAEIEKFFRAADADEAGFLSRMDLERALPAPSGSMGPGDRPTKEQLIKGLFRQEIGSLQSGPNLDESAPDFTLKTADGKDELTLSKVVGPKPVVLIFGNFTCGPFRSMAGNFEKLQRRYGDRATFVMVYVREAHPSDGWRMQSNDAVGVSTAQPTSYEERAGVAQQCGKLLGLGFPMLVDTIDDAVGARYSGMPGRFYLIDKAGKIAFKNARGPFGFKPAELEQSLILLLQDEAPGGESQARAEAR
jgi:thiol-disulfide isomerase/thioredoxin